MEAFLTNLREGELLQETLAETAEHLVDLLCLESTFPLHIFTKNLAFPVKRLGTCFFLFPSHVLPELVILASCHMLSGYYIIYICLSDSFSMITANTIFLKFEECYATVVHKHFSF